MQQQITVFERIFEKAKVNFAKRLEHHDSVARTRHQDIQQQTDVMRQELVTTTEALNHEITQNRLQSKKIQRYQHLKKVYKARIQDLEDRVLSEVSRSEVVSRESAAAIAHLLKKLDNLGSQLADHRNQLTTLRRFKKRWQMHSGRAKAH